MTIQVLEHLKKDFNNRIGFRDKGKNGLQLIAPFYHEDGDMYDIFIDPASPSGVSRVCDHGMTLMRLSYSYELDTPKKEAIFSRILAENGVGNDNGNLFIETPPEGLSSAILRFSQVVAKITNMSLFKREVVRSLFYEDLASFVEESLARYNPVRSYLPLPAREDLEVDFNFTSVTKPIFMFGVKDGTKARLVTISCLEYMRSDLPFRSVAVHENFEELSARDRKIITNVVDKQFTDLDDFRVNADKYFEREIA